MITLPNGKICMNEQEAIQWLLDNYPIPFQCSANYAPETEIGLATIVNPTPAKVKVGSIIFFADSKVSTVIGVNANSFICSDKYNDLVDDVVYVSNVQLNASGHLIVTLSNGTDIDAGLIKQVTGFSINGSQHLIVSYNDGTSTDLGAIFNGNIAISGNLTVTGGISGNAITGDSIIENMSGYSVTSPSTDTHREVLPVYAGACKNGNKVTFVVFFKFKPLENDLTGANSLIEFNFTIPSAVGTKLYPYQIAGYNFLDFRSLEVAQDDNFARKNITAEVTKNSNTSLSFKVYAETGVYGELEQNKTYVARFEETFLLSDNLAA